MTRSHAYVVDAPPRIAIVGPLTGGSAHVGLEMRQAAELAVEEHARRAPMGPIVAEVYDDGADVARGHLIAREIAAREEIVGVVGHYNADVTLAASGVYEQHGLAMITPIAANPELTELGRRLVFRYCNRNDRTATAISTHLRGVLGKRTAAVIATRSAYGRSMAEEFEHAFHRLGGDVALSRSVPIGQRDFGSLVADIPESVDVVFYGGSFEGAALLRTLRRDGHSTLFAAGDGCWDVRGFLEPAGEACEQGEGVLVLASTPETAANPKAREFANAFAARHGQIGNYAANSYDAASMLLTAVESAASPSRTDVADALRTMRFTSIAYPTPSAWTANGDNVATVTALNTVRGGRFQTIAIIPNCFQPPST